MSKNNKIKLTFDILAFEFFYVFGSNNYSNFRIHSRVIYDLTIRCGYEVIGFVDDNKSVNEIIYHKTIIGNITDLPTLHYRFNCDFIIFRRVNYFVEHISKTYDIPYTTLICPTPSIAMDVQIGVGTVVLASAIINSCAKLGNYVIINSKSIVEHDNTIGNYAHLSSKLL